MGIHVLGAVINRMGREAFNLPEKEVEEILETRVLAVVPEDYHVREAAYAGVPLIIRAPDSHAAIAIKKLAADMIGERYRPPKPRERVIDRIIRGLMGRY
jgi:MinD-like ATPase involved in chromosome partitioning or flagellar assembly